MPKRISNKLEITNDILDIINEFNWYDKQIFDLFYNKKVSIKELSKDTGINLTSLYKTLKDINSKIINNG